MMEETTYRTLDEPSTSIFKDRNSKFLGFVEHVETENDVKQIVSKYKKQYHDARHCCYAYKLGLENQVCHFSDDGEPHNTAGKPILSQINSFGVTNVIVVVIRYFGGTLLGTSGLINAYGTVAHDAIKNGRIVDVEQMTNIRVVVDCSLHSDVIANVKKHNCKIIEQLYNYETNTYDITICTPLSHKHIFDNFCYI